MMWRDSHISNGAFSELWSREIHSSCPVGAAFQFVTQPRSKIS